MSKILNTFITCIVLSLVSWAQVTIHVSQPANNATVSSPTFISASAESSNSRITGWRIYVDNVNVYHNPGPTVSIGTNVSLSAGTHRLIIRAWDASGANGSAYLTVNVSVVAQVPPATAHVVSKIEELQNWKSCRSYSCSGSDAWASYGMVWGVTSPSLDGSSTKFWVKGNPYADVLWTRGIGPQNYATHVLMDFWLKVGPDTLTYTQALEFDLIQAIKGMRYEFSTQCHYVPSNGIAYSHWDTWDNAVKKWIHTNIACPRFDPNKWYHIKLYGERVGSKVHYISVTVNDVAYKIADQYNWRAATPTNWADTVVVQIQQDLNSKGGTSSEWIDKLTVYLW